MECPRCRHVSTEKAPNFCSQCGQKLVPGAPMPGPESGTSLVVTSPPEVAMELGEALLEEDSLPPGSAPKSLESFEWLENPDESSSDASWTIQKGAAVSVDAAGNKAEEQEAACCSPSKKRKLTALVVEDVSEVAGTEQKKRRRKKNSHSTPSSEPGSLAPGLSGLPSLDLPPSLASQSQVQQDGPTSQPGQPQGAQKASLEGKDSGARAEGVSSPAHSQTTGDTASSPAHSQTAGASSSGVEGRVQSSHNHTQGKDLYQEGGCGPTPSVSQSHPETSDAAQTVSLPGPQENKPECMEGASVAALQSAGVREEAETEDKLAVPGKKTGEKGNMKLDGQKAGESGQKKAGESGQKKAGESDQKKAGESDQKKAGESDQKKVGESGQKKAGESDQKKPEENDQKKAGESDQKKVGESGQKKPGESDQKKPEENDQKKAGESGQKKAGESGQKRAGENSRNYAAAVKNDKELRNQKAATQDVKASISTPSPEGGVTVYFHAILSKDFKFDPSVHRVFVRGGSELGKERWTNVCEMNYTKDLQDNGALIEGSMVIPRRSLDRAIPYKYVVQRSGKDAVEYEFIYKKAEKKGEHVNRCLNVGSALVGAGDWHQYDDIICMRPPGRIQEFFDYFTDSKRKELVRGKKLAAKVMLDQILSVLTPWSDVNLQSFVTQFRQFYSVVRVPMIYEGSAQPWHSLPYKEGEVKAHLWELMKNQMAPFLEGNSVSDGSPVKSKLRLGLIVLFMGDEVGVELQKSDLVSLCSLLTPSASSPDTLHSELSLFRSKSHRWRTNLVNLYQRCMDVDADHWVGTLPVLHYCMQLPAPRKDSMGQTEDNWAGLEGLTFSAFREKSPTKSQLLGFLEQKGFLLHLDQHLFRSWFSLLPLSSLAGYLQYSVDYLSHVPARVLDCFQGLSYRLRGLKVSIQKSKEDVKNILKMLLHLVEIFQGSLLGETPLKTYLTECLSLHESVCQVITSWELFEIPALSAEMICQVMKLKHPEDATEGLGATGREDLVASAFQRALTITRTWLCRLFKEKMFWTSQTFPRFTYSGEFSVWRRLVEIDFPGEHDWKGSLLREMEGRLKQEHPRAQIVVFCSNHWSDAGQHDSVARRFEQCVIEAVSSACQSQTTSILQGLSCQDLQRFGTLLSAVITKSWPRKNGEAVLDMNEIFKFLLTGPDVQQLFKLCGTNKKILANFSEEGQELMATAKSVFGKVSDGLFDGSIEVGQLDLILKHRQQFMDIWNLRRKSVSSQEDMGDVRDMLRQREDDLRFLRTEHSHVDGLLKQCGKVKSYVQVDFGEIEELHSTDLSRTKLSEAVVNLPGAERTTHYCLSSELREMAGMIDSLKNSRIFQIFWEQAAENCEESTFDLEEAYYHLYWPCYKKFLDIYKALRSGDITFAEVDVIFKDFKDKYSELSAELLVMCSVDPQALNVWVPKRVRQIKEYHSLHQAASSARVISQVQRTLGLTGDFSVLDKLLEFTDLSKTFFGSVKLNEISPQLIEAKKLLKDISKPRRQCLEQLVRRTDFVTWVREALRDTNELKVFVDLASISAGENDIDVDRVACFHDAVQGYSCLLYKLDAGADFQTLMGHLQDLWKALGNDQHLPKKLQDSARNLEWLKTVKESHGSVELSSLTLATAINKRGVYVVKAPKDGRKISPDNVLHLRLPEEHDDRVTRHYSAEDLKELLNKLMLMSSKKDHSSNVEAERFSEVFSNVQRLVHAFINLHCAGHMLFRTWSAEVHCCPTLGFCIRMDFGLELVSPLMDNGDVLELLGALCREMELCLGHWKSFVDQKRAEHFYLNFYTAEQLVCLSSELRKQRPSETILTMLSFIKGHCTARDVAEATRLCDGKDARRTVRLAADTLVQRLLSERSLVSKLRIIMEQSVACASALLPGCLDLDALGQCLALLADLGGPPVERLLPKGLQAGQPNLVLCGHSEVLPATLAVYMQAPEQPLPTFDEVLLCTPGTTLEEVELLMRRCLTPGSRGRKVYSLLFADQLSYEVSYQAETLFQSLCKRRHREDYQLVIVCDAAREHCHLPSTFSQHKVPLVPQAPLSDTQAYLGYHYQVPEQTPSAAAVFKDRMCVGIVTSERAGVGKSLYVKRLHEELKCVLDDESVPLKVIRLTDPQVDESKVFRSLLPFLGKTYQTVPVIFHIDVATSVQTGVSVFLFKLLVLQYLMDLNGHMWLRNPCHLYVIEISQRSSAQPKISSKLNAHVPQFSFLDVFPRVMCRPPKEVIDMELAPGRDRRDPRMDLREFRSETFQRPYQYLRRFHQGQNLDAFQYQEDSVEGSPEECLQHFLIYCGVINPSWSELRNFALFLNCQLRDCEASVFCKAVLTGDTLRGFKNFVVTFMILMARDFATPTLQCSDQSPGSHLVTMDGVAEEDLAPFTLRKRWESEPHPYVFFNGDHTTMTFIGFHLQANSRGHVDAINPSTGRVIKKDVMSQRLYDGLCLQKVRFNIDFDSLPRHEKLQRLCLALGIEWPSDPDESYELTTDNMLKILAIEMRFRCGIPVVIMGETGCGKTRLIKFLSDLRRSNEKTETMMLMKVHGGTTASMIYSKVREAQSIACYNMVQHKLNTILFFDEANTTEAISCIKEVLCDGTVDGECLAVGDRLHIIAACNPYRKHSQEMILRLESAGLGYRVRAEETADRLGSIPLRQLVYRVHALPPSLVPLVWDFGQLNNVSEKLYIQQIVQRLVDTIQISTAEMRVITAVLFGSQKFMRTKQNECGFVSLRDVERCVKVFKWFHDHSGMLLAELSTFLHKSGRSKHDFERDPVLWALVMAIGVCYHASLEEKESYRKMLSARFPEPYNDGQAILDEITLAQDLFLSGAPVRTNIARNLALKENVFMMVICIELKIPLFLVGKPGSSKSLAKIIVADAMQGQAAYSALFRCLKQVHLVSFQCSPHSTPQGIIGTFKQCARFQQDKDLEQYVSVVVLDEVGLAEDSPQMPLKTLHPLLEDGCIDDDPAPHKEVGFIGISNWALDPAKMNRGIFVSRGNPNEKELIESAEGICSSDRLVQDRIRGYFVPFAEAYERVCQTQDKEFFGLRDYYSLIKMVFAKAKASNREPSPRDLAHAILRNFSGHDDVRALDIFTARLPEAKYTEEVSTVELIQQNLYGDVQSARGGELENAESRYLLVLTRNYVALQILQQKFFGGDHQPEIIFGSSFPRDQEYTQICRNINRVKVCMETGKTVVLLNLQNLYESLYDALNQYYVHLGGQKYVDLGLGTHRVKCRVHADFRLIVIEEKDVVYKQFPVPLINRLEKHYLDINTVLEGWQRRLVRELQVWAHAFADTKTDPFLARQKYNTADVFIGYHADACASAVLQAVARQGPGALSEELHRKVTEDAKLILLDCATPDAIVRLHSSALGVFVAKSLSQKYYTQQQHDSLSDFLQVHLRSAHQERHAVFTEITTFSRLLTSGDCEDLEAELQGLAPKPLVLSLQQFDTEYSFLKEVRTCLMDTTRCKILIIQTDFEDSVHGPQLIASARYSAINEINKMQGREDCVFIYFITKLSRAGSGAPYVGFHGGLWRSVHIDDLRRSSVMASDVTKLQSVTLSQLFKPADHPAPEPPADGTREEEMDTEGPSAEEEEVEMDVDGPEEKEQEAFDAEGSDVLDTTRLLHSCVQGAVGMLRDQSENCTRNMRRVTLLLGLLTEDDASNASFLRVAKLHLHALLKKQEENQAHRQEWVSREAANQDALQEAGTFRHALWKRVQGAVTPILASIISHIDRDGNLELLTQPDLPPWARGLWMFIFSDIKFLNIPLVAHSVSSRNEMSTILVQSHMHLLRDACNAVPFSWRIKDNLEELWVQAQYITDPQGLPKKLVEIFQKTPLGQFLAQLPTVQHQQLLQRYCSDFLRLTLRVSSWEELEFLQMALWSCLSELRLASGVQEDRLSLPWVHLAYQRFRTRLQNFSRILSIQPQVLRSLAGAAQRHELAGREMTLDAFAAMACVEILTRDTLRPSPQAWLQLVKRLATPLELICSDGYLQDCGGVAGGLIKEVRAQWNRIFSVSLFVEHVLLGVESQIPELTPLVTDCVFSLDRRLKEDSDIKTHRPFVAVMSTLCTCKDAVSTTFSRFGVQPCPICLGDARDPVCLPCEHVFCLSCIRTWLVPGQMNCPYCLTDLPDTFSPGVSQEHRKAIKKLVQFRKLCNSFFVDLVSTMCFKGNSPPQSSVIDSLLSLLFIRKPTSRHASQELRDHTKCLSPFDDVVDKTPIIRSVVLKLLLKYSFQEVSGHIQSYLTQLENMAFLEQEKTELYLLFISCLEDSVNERMSACYRSDRQGRLQEEGHFLRTYSPGWRGQEPPTAASVQYLQEVARVRLCLDWAADLLSKRQAGSELTEDQRRFLEHVEHFCTRSNNDWHRVYLVRQLSSLCGMEFVQGFSRRGHPYQWVFPRDVITQQKDHVGQMDRYLVHGEEYKALRDVLGKALLEGKTLDAKAVLTACKSPHARQAVHLLLALDREVAALCRCHNANLHPKPEQREAVNTFIQESKILSAPIIQHFAKSLVDNTLPWLRTGSGDSSLEGTVTEMAIHAAAILLCGQNEVLGPLRNLAFYPDNMKNAFLPTMPEDLLAQARSWQGLEHVFWYTCPNGHPCSVGECGKPMEQSVCVDCGSQIGGLNHNPSRGFTAIRNNEDRTQTGHVLGRPLRSDTAVASDRGLSPVVFILARLLTHLAMLLGASQHPQALITIIKPPVQDPQGFLRGHIRRDLEQLTKTLGRSADETTHAVHLVLRSLLQEQHPRKGRGALNFNAELSTKEYRNNWEKHFQALLLPELEHLHKTLQTVNVLISQDERISSNPVAKIIYGDPATFLPHLPQKNVVHCSKIWSCRNKITVEYLQHIVEQKNGKETTPVLWHFLQKEAELRQVKFLPEILALQRDLVKWFQNVPEVEEYSSIRGFIDSHRSDGLRQLLLERINIFLSTWNALRRSLETKGEIKLPKDYCRSDLDLDTEFEVILPRRRGLGLCSTALVSYLIRLHNEMVYTVEEFSQDNNSYSVDASEITDLHVISYEVERDLTPLILSSCQYQVQQGGETVQEFDLEKIQRQISGRFLQGKPRLTLKGIPTLVYRRDWNFEHLFVDIKNKMAQSPLPSSTASTIRGQLQSYSDACEALTLTEVTLGFLSTAGGDPGVNLSTYIRDTLQMVDQPTPVLKALNTCQLRHAIALWQFLSSHKSTQLLKLKKEPFREVSEKYKHSLSSQNTRLLQAFLNEASLETFLVELHELIVLKLRKPQAEDSFNPTWSLRDTLVSYMETKDTDVLPEVETQFPEEILMSNCVSVWKTAATWSRTMR